MLCVELVGTGDAGRHHGCALQAVAAQGGLAWTAIGARDATGVATFRAELGVADSVVARAPLGFSDDPSFLANLDVLDRIGQLTSPGAS